MINGKDILLTSDGDFQLDEDRDIKLASDESLVEQKINITIKTSNPDWFYDEIGADLEDLVGMEHSKTTADIGKKRIISALTQHGFFAPNDIYVEAKPYNKYTMLFMVFIKMPGEGESQVYRIALDLGSGATIGRVR